MSCFGLAHEAHLLYGRIGGQANLHRQHHGLRRSAHYGLSFLWSITHQKVAAAFVGLPGAAHWALADAMQGMFKPVLCLATVGTHLNVEGATRKEGLIPCGATA